MDQITLDLLFEAQTFAESLTNKPLTFRCRGGAALDLFNFRSEDGEDIVIRRSKQAWKKVPNSKFSSLLGLNSDLPQNFKQGDTVTYYLTGKLLVGVVLWYEYSEMRGEWMCKISNLPYTTPEKFVWRV